MTISPLAGEPAPKDILVDLARLEREYYTCWPDVRDPTLMVSFGTSGHRGSPLHGSFTEPCKPLAQAAGSERDDYE